MKPKIEGPYTGLSAYVAKKIPGPFEVALRSMLAVLIIGAMLAVSVFFGVLALWYRVLAIVGRKAQDVGHWMLGKAR